MHPGLSKLGLLKERREKIAMLTAYDYPTARLLDEGGVDVLLVGDSLGMVVLGYPDTTLVTLDEMVHHTRAVARGVKRAPILADLPIGTFDTPEQALLSARRLIDAGAHGVKLEGGAPYSPHIRALSAEIPVMAHIGMQPQRVRIEGGYRIKGKNNAEAKALMQDATAAEAAGAFGILMELVSAHVAKEITATAKVPTIGIGSGQDCDGQVLVTHDLIGFFPWFTPKFAVPAANVADEVRKAVSTYIARIRATGAAG